MRVLLTILRIISVFWAAVGLISGFFAYVYLGIQPRYLGWPLAILTEIFLGLEVWDEGLFVGLFFANLPIAAVLALYFQNRSDESDEEGSVDDAMIVEVIYSKQSTKPLDQMLSRWLKESLSWSSVFGGMWLISAFFINGMLDEALFVGLSATSITLLTIKFKGGKKGRFWSSLKNLANVKIGLPIPSPS